MIPSNAIILINAIKSTGKKLTPQESGFLASVSVQSKANRLLTEKQSKWLEGIYAKCTGGGQREERQYVR